MGIVPWQPEVEGFSKCKVVPQPRNKPTPPPPPHAGPGFKRPIPRGDNAPLLVERRLGRSYGGRPVGRWRVCEESSEIIYIALNFVQQRQWASGLCVRLLAEQPEDKHTTSACRRSNITGIIHLTLCERCGPLNKFRELVFSWAKCWETDCESQLSRLRHLFADIWSWTKVLDPIIYDKCQLYSGARVKHEMILNTWTKFNGNSSTYFKIFESHNAETITLVGRYSWLVKCHLYSQLAASVYPDLYPCKLNILQKIMENGLYHALGCVV